MFSHFGGNDDEGYVLISLRHFLDGHALYSEINTQYGPFFYAVFGTLFKLTGVTVATGSGRLLQLGVWILAALLCGLAAHRISGRLILGAATTIVTFRTLSVFLNEPMHPGALLSLLVATTAFVLVVLTPRYPRAALATLGALAAAATLVKVNVGGFVFIALVFALSRAGSGWLARPLTRRLVAALFVALAPLLMLPDLGHVENQNFAIVVAAGAVALLLVASPPTKPGGPSVTSWWLWLVTGAAAVTTVITVAMIALGTSLPDLIDGTLIRPTKQRTVYTILPGVPNAAVLWALVSVGVAYALRVGRLNLNSERSGALRIAVGLGLWFVPTATGPFLFGQQSVLGVLPLLAWIAAVPPADDESTPTDRFIRIGLPALAILQMLHAYPVAGSQVGFASVLYPLIGAVCIGDGLKVLAPYWPDARALTALTLGLAAWATLVFIVRDGHDAHKDFKAGTPVPYAGATRLHAPESQVSGLIPVIEALKAKGCRVVFESPGLGTLTMWAGADVPVGLEPDSWPVQLDAERQQEVLDRAGETGQVCGLRNPDVLEGWLQGRTLQRRPVVRYIDSMKPYFTSGNYTLLAPE